MPEQSQWRRPLDALDRATAPRVEAAVQTPQFAEAMVTFVQVEREIRRRFERFTRQVLHAVNLPAGSDIKRLAHQLADLDDRLRDLSKRLEEIEPPRDGRP